MSLDLTTISPSLTIIFLVKIGLLIVSVFYFLFSLVISQRIVSLTKTLVTSVSPVIRILAVAHLIASILVLGFVASVVFLFK